MSVVTSTRERILFAASELFRRQGFAATGLKSILAASDAPYGSLYHFFPGGKDDLTAAVITTSGAAYRELFEAIANEAASPAAAVTDFFDGAALVLEETDFIDPCPIGTVAREVASTNEALRRATDQVFGSWIDAVTIRLGAAGIEKQDAHRLAAAIVAALEGGFVLARARRDADVLRDTGRIMHGAVENALARATVDSNRA